MDPRSHVRNRPDRLEHLCRTTRFNKREIKMLYRGFKQECPTGIVQEDTFKQIYAQFFPLGKNTRLLECNAPEEDGSKPWLHPSQYAHYVFKTLDRNRNGNVNFQHLLSRLSLLSRGSTQDKLRWAFGLYDLNGDGHITQPELLHIVSAIYQMMGLQAARSGESGLRQHVARIFQKLDANQDGVVTMEEFMEACQKDDGISESLQLFDTIL